MTREGALPLAIALFHEPVLRHDWRLQPLPADIGQLLALVGGEPRRLEQAAAGLGTTPEDLLQAARFYVQEILLFADADDRRLLGLADGDGPETVRSHYRYLQSWLHPDRGGASRAETVHAARINAAWSRLRAASAAEAVAPGHEDAVEPGHAPMAAPATRVQHWVRIEEEVERRPKRWLLAVPVAIAIGGGWLWLASHPPTGTGDAWPGIEEGETAAATPPSISAAVRQSERTAASHPAPALAAPSALETADATTPGVRSSPLGTDAGAGTSTGTAPRPPPPAAPIPPSSAPAATAAMTTSPGASAAAGPETRVANAGAPQTVHPLEPVVAAATATRRAPPPADATPSPKPVVTSRIPPANAEPPPVAKAVPASDATGSRAAASTSPPVAAFASTPAPAAPDLAGRDLAAQQRGDALLAYLTRAQAAPPPIWRSGQALDDAAAIRRDLAEGGRRRPQVLHDQARWHIEPAQARLQVPVEPADRSGPRLLRAGLRWENDAWWVESIALEDAR